MKFDRYSNDQLDFLNLMLQYGHDGWYSMKLFLHLGQYHDMADTGV
jgi:hypothetical protein